MRLSVAFLATACFLAGPNAVHAHANASPAQIHPAKASAQSQRIDALLAQEMKERRIPGAQVAVVQNGRIVFAKSYGLANLQTPVPVSNATLFSINSATKSFTGVAAMQLVERGQLDLDTSISVYLGDLPPSWRPVTVRDLLAHISGLPNIVDPQTGEMLGRSEAEAWTIVRQKELEFTPRTRSSYNQTNYLLLGKIIEKLSGETFPAFIANHQFAVVPMPGAGFGDSRDVVPGKSQSYRFDYSASPQGTLRPVYEEFPSGLRPGAGINTTAKDLAAWLVALTEGKLIGPDTRLKDLWSPPRLVDGTSASWALGWPIRTRKHLVIPGGQGGGRSAFSVYPDQKIAVVVLTNLSGANPEDFLDNIAHLYAPGIQTSDVANLRDQLNSHGFSAATRLVDAAIQSGTPLDLPEGELNSWAYRLLRAGNHAESLEIFKLIVHLNPESANAHDSLGEAYLAAGYVERAIASYEESLRLDPANANAAEQLRILRMSPQR